MKKKIALALALAACAMLVVALVGCGGGTSTPAATPAAPSGGTSSGGTTISEANFAFSPSTLTVKVGDTVTWVNNDSTAHRVTINGQDLGQQDPGKSVTWTAAKAGSFPYSCVIHPSMTGQITVQ